MDPKTQPETPEEIDLTRIVDLIVGGRWLIGIVTAVAVVAGAIYAFTATDIYRGDMLLQIEREQAAVPGLVDVLASDQTQTSTEIELLRSRMVLGRVVEQLRLADDEDSLYAIARLRDQVQIVERGGGRRGESGVLELSMEHEDPEYIVRVLNTIGNYYVRQNVERRSAEAARSLEFLDSQLPELRRELEVAEERFNDFRREHGAVDLEAESRVMLEQLVQVESQLKQLRINEAELALRYGREHPEMQSLRSRRASLETVQSELESGVGALPERQQQLLRLRREVEVNTVLYTSLLNTAQELRIAQAGTVGNVRVVDEAAVHPEPVFPRKALILALSLVLGFVAGAAVVFARELLRRGITDPDAIEAALGLPVYAVIPHSPEQKRAERDAKRSGTVIGILTGSHPDDPTVESVRSLRTGLTFALMDAVRNVVVVTSPGPENGKTFVSMNLAQVLADGGQRVLVIDADLRRGHVARYLTERHEMPGLSEVLAGKATAESAILPLVAGKIDVLPCGTFPPNPSELLLRPEFGALLDAQRARYDLVIVDTAPILAVTDGVIVAAHAGAVFLVLRAGKTTEREARAALRRLEQGHVRTTGVIVNDLDPEREGRREYYYYKYKYPTGSR